MKRLIALMTILLLLALVLTGCHGSRERADF